jgi:hypothetical protein
MALMSQAALKTHPASKIPKKFGSSVKGLSNRCEPFSSHLKAHVNLLVDELLGCGYNPLRQS